MQLKAYAVKTDQGPYLNINEDGYEFDIIENFYFLMDGFGGSGVGDKCVEEIKQNMRGFYNKIAQDPDSTLPFFFSPKFLIEGNALINAMIFTHKKIFEQNMKVDMSKRAGSSGIFAIKHESIFTFASVGNCMGYLLRSGSIQKIFIPDDFNLLSSDQFEKHYRTMPLSAFGLFSDLYYQVKEVRVEKGDAFILLSDGVHSRLAEHEILHYLEKNESGDQQKILETLFDLANKRGNLDNQTAMLLQF
jgi:serine/threonine protein phosphatase PrpC